MNAGCCTNAPGQNPYARANFQATRITKSTVDVSASTGISLVTADGDKVTLAATSSLHASLETYDYRGRTQGQRIAASGEKFQLSTTSGYAITVEGSLSEAEIADINELLDAIASASQNILSGNGANVLEQLAELDGLDTISSYAATFNYSRQTSAISARQISITPAAQSQDSTEGTAATPAADSQDADSFLRQLAKAAEQLGSGGNHHRIPKRFARLLEKLGLELPLDRDDRRLADGIHSEHSRRSHGHHRRLNEVAPAPMPDSSAAVTDTSSAATA